MNNYEKEKIEFETNFSAYKEKRIVLYGIGRFSATLIPMLNDWNIVGLMDKNPEKTGTYVYGLPILESTEVESKADLVIINTSGTYWNLIFQRIKHINIPIYYRNGVKAEEEVEQEKIEYWKASFSQLRNAINFYTVISFDFFDTLFCRKTYIASDIWEYVGDSLIDERQREEYLQSRKSIYIDVNKEAARISDIYEKMDSDISILEEKEIELENRFTVPRNSMVTLLLDAVRAGKEVYVISDMYLPPAFFLKKLKEYGIELPEEHVWISCDYGVTKRSGELWSKFRKEVVKEGTAFHIGDNMKSDIDNCKKYAKVDTYYVMSSAEMLHKSTIRDCLQYANKIYHNMLLGLCISRMFNNPFSLCDTEGKVKIDSREDFGYCVFGPVIFTFVVWLLKSVEVDSVYRICFLGRDGFFLKQNFEYLCKLLNCSYKVKAGYMETSRQILMCANIENESDFDEYMRMPYEGSLNEFFEDRLQIKLCSEDKKAYEKKISMPQDYEKVKKIIFKYKEEITNYIRATKKQYRMYVETFDLKEQDAIVDLGYYGTTQHYLSKFLHKEFIGYYIVANGTDGNVLSGKHTLRSCTSISTDKSCKNAYIHSMGLAIESFLTSPHGMVRGVGYDGKFIYSPDTNNQMYFEDKIAINEGIKLFIKDMIELHCERLDKLHIYIDDFVDNWYGLLIKKSILSEGVKRSFYNDNAFIHRRCERIFDAT